MSYLKHFLYFSLFQAPRILKYWFLSTCKNISGHPRRVQPVLLCGGGRIRFGRDVTLGWNPSPFLYSGYVFIAARSKESLVEIGDGTALNCNAVLYSLGAGIRLGRNVLAGTNLEIYDSDFHVLDARRRGQHQVESKAVVVGDDVFIGSNVRILKGVTIGRNCVIGNSSVVTRSFPDNVVIAGNPAKVIRPL